MLPTEKESEKVTFCRAVSAVLSTPLPVTEIDLPLDFKDQFKQLVSRRIKSNQTYWDTLQEADQDQLFELLGRGPEGLLACLSQGIVSLPALLQSPKHAHSLLAYPLLAFLIGKIELSSLWPASLSNQAIEQRLSKLHHPLFVALMYFSSEEQEKQLADQWMALSQTAMHDLSNPIIYQLVREAKLSLNTLNQLDETRRERLLSREVRLLLKNNCPEEDILLLEDTGYQHLKDPRIRRQVQHQLISIFELNQLSSDAINHRLIDAFHPLVMEKTLQVIPTQTVPKEDIQQCLYQGQAAIYYDEAIDQTLEGFLTTRYAMSLEQFNRVLEKLKLWVEKNHVQPSVLRKSASSVLAIFQKRIGNDYFSDHRVLIYRNVKRDLEEIVLLLDYPKIPQEIKRRVISHYLDGLEGCSGGVQTNTHDTREALATVGKASAAYLKRARYRLAEQAAIEAVRHSGSIDSGQEVHAVNAVLTLYGNVLGIQVAIDPFIISNWSEALLLRQAFVETWGNPEKLTPALLAQLAPYIIASWPESFLLAFQKNLPSLFDPLKIVGALTQAWLPEVEAILDQTESLVSLEDKEAALHALLLPLGSGGDHENGHDYALDHFLCVCLPRERAMVLSLIIQRLLFAGGYFDPDEQEIITSPHYTYTIYNVPNDSDLSQIEYRNQEGAITGLYSIPELLEHPDDFEKLSEEHAKHLMKNRTLDMLSLRFRTMVLLLHKRIDCGCSPLFMAASRGEIETLTAANLSQEVINQKEILDSTLFHIAVFMGHVNVIQLLLSRGANLNLTGYHGATALHLAVGHLDVIKLLLKAGMKPNLHMNDGATALHIATYQSQGCIDVVDSLLKAKANPNSRMNDGATSLYIAAQAGYFGVAKLFLKNGANPNLRKKNDGATPLFVAAQEGHVGIVQLLLDNKATPNLDNIDHATPLFVAAQEGHLDVVKLLLKAGADPDLHRRDSATPLVIATRHGYIDIVKKLLQCPRLNVDVVRQNIIGFIGKSFDQVDPTLYATIQKNISMMRLYTLGVALREMPLSSWITGINNGNFSFLQTISVEDIREILGFVKNRSGMISNDMETIEYLIIGLRACANNQFIQLTADHFSTCLYTLDLLYQVAKQAYPAARQWRNNLREKALTQFIAMIDQYDYQGKLPILKVARDLALFAAQDHLVSSPFFGEDNRTGAVIVIDAKIQEVEYHGQDIVNYESFNCKRRKMSPN